MLNPITKGDLERALVLLPKQLFRQTNIFDVAVELGFEKYQGQALWNGLSKRLLIRRTKVQIGRSLRRCYWERTPNMSISPYIVQTADGTTCPRCRRQPRLLIHEEGNISKTCPAFYICRCGFIGKSASGR